MLNLYIVSILFILSASYYTNFYLQNPQVLRPKDDFMQILSRWWQDQEQSIVDFTLTKKTSDQFILPDWLNGEFIVSGPSKWKIGDKQMGHVFDGFGRFNRFKIKNGQIKFSSKLMNGEWFKKMSDDFTTSLSFKETFPPRWGQKIPFKALLNTLDFDNNYVLMERMPDNKTYVGSTDDQRFVKIDIETLETQGNIQWHDDLLTCLNGPSHQKTSKNGTIFGICVEQGIVTKWTAYYITSDNMYQRKRIGSVHTNLFSPYSHSFGLTENHIIIFESQSSYSLLGYIFGEDFVNTLKPQCKETKIHIFNIKTGQVQTINSGIIFQFMHSSNSFEANGKIIVDATVYENCERFIYDKFSYKNLVNQDNLAFDDKGVYKRFIINMNNLTLETEDLIKLDIGNYELPTFNRFYDGIRENCYTYLVNYFGKNEYNENYSFDITKYDSCQRQIQAVWHQKSYVQGEPFFIANPKFQEEDDGLILSLGHNLKQNVSYLVIIDPKNMKTLQQYEMPINIPLNFHARFWPDEK